jgi:hypothetical protein
MIHIILPRADRRVNLRAFWLIITLALGIPVSLLALGGAKHYLIAGAAVMLGLGALLWLDESTAWRFYRGWNRFLARPIAKAAQGVVLRLCFLLLRAASLQQGSGLAGGVWRKRTTLRPEEYFVGIGSSGDQFSWRREYQRWASESGHLWAVCLLPFLALLRWLSPEEEKIAAGNIYTLF